jgi:hypothetical protein
MRICALAAGSQLFAVDVHIGGSACGYQELAAALTIPD